jgi:hypothetical protein
MGDDMPEQRIDWPTLTTLIQNKQEEMVMLRRIGRLFGPDYERYEGVYRINIYLLRALFALMFVVLGRDVWTHILTHEGPWDPDEAVAWCVWASFSVFAVLGMVRPLKILPLVLLEIAYKVLWLILVAYPLWSTDRLAGSPAEERTYAFLWVVLPIVAMPWKYAFEHYVRGRKNMADRQAA